MGQPLSMVLRTRLLAAIDTGMSCRSAAVRFGVAPLTAIRWQAQRRTTGSFAPKPQGGDTRSRRVEERREEISNYGDRITVNYGDSALNGCALHPGNPAPKIAS